MPLDADFLKTAAKHFNPYTLQSGTEHVAMLLYSLVRMNRPKTVVEYGSGYSTMFVLRALADNIKDFELEKTQLIKKTKELLNHTSIDDLTEENSQLAKWLYAEGKACQVNPGFFLTSYVPRLCCLEDLDEGHDYVGKMKMAVAETGHSDLFTLFASQSGFDLSPLNLNGSFVDLAWNDSYHYREFFSAFWEVMNPKGGLLIFHNAITVREAAEDIQWMIEQRSDAGDLEVLTLEEPHKLNQNGCVILRKTSDYSPSFYFDQPREVLDHLRLFVEKYC